MNSPPRTPTSAPEIAGGARGAEIVVIGAHYDSVLGTRGANDNATGVAALLGLARAPEGVAGGGRRFGQGYRGPGDAALVPENLEGHEEVAVVPLKPDFPHAA